MQSILSIAKKNAFLPLCNNHPILYRHSIGFFQNRHHIIAATIRRQSFFPASQRPMCSTTGHKTRRLVHLQSASRAHLSRCAISLLPRSVPPRARVFCRRLCFFCCIEDEVQSELLLLYFSKSDVISTVHLWEVRRSIIFLLRWSFGEFIVDREYIAFDLSRGCNMLR